MAKRLISPEQIAWQAIKKYSPGKESLLTLKQTTSNDYEPGKYTFTFIRLLNRIPFDRDSITVTISQQNGDVLGCQIRWRPVHTQIIAGLFVYVSKTSLILIRANSEPERLKF